MSLYTVSSGTTINAADINQLVNVLAQQSGGQEIGTYFLQGGTYEGGWVISNWIVTRSYGSTPVSVTLDTSISSSNANTPTAAYTSNSGFQTQFSATAGSGINHTSRAAGHYTVQY